MIRWAPLTCISTIETWNKSSNGIYIYIYIWDTRRTRIDICMSLIDRWQSLCCRTHIHPSREWCDISQQACIVQTRRGFDQYILNTGAAWPGAPPHHVRCAVGLFPYFAPKRTSKCAYSYHLTLYKMAYKHQLTKVPIIWRRIIANLRRCELYARWKCNAHAAPGMNQWVDFPSNILSYTIKRCYRVSRTQKNIVSPRRRRINRRI